MIRVLLLIQGAACVAIAIGTLFKAPETRADYGTPTLLMAVAYLCFAAAELVERGRK